MKIGIIGSYGYKIPLEKGKIHAPLYLAWQLACKLAKFRHDVTFYGSHGKSREIDRNLHYKNVEYFSLDQKIKDSEGTACVWEQAKIIYQQGFLGKILSTERESQDLFYSWAASFIGPLTISSRKPVVMTHHDSTNPDRYNLMFKAFGNKNAFLIPISEFMKNRIHYDNTLDVVHNGVDESEIHFTEKPDDYYCWVGRITPSKGTHIAIHAAIQAGVKLKIAGPMHESLPDFGDMREYLAKIKKLIAENRNIEYSGVLTQEDTYRLIGGARGIIFPTDGIESFSMVTAEAIMAGTPVIATNKGPIPEIIKDGKNGYLINDEHDVGSFVEAIGKIEAIDRKKCREDAIERFSIEKMARGYEKQFEIAIEKWSKNAKS